MKEKKLKRTYALLDHLNTMVFMSLFVVGFAGFAAAFLIADVAPHEWAGAAALTTMVVPGFGSAIACACIMCKISDRQKRIASIIYKRYDSDSKWMMRSK